MRWIVLIIVPLIVLLAVYTVWPIYDLYRIASAVETRNLATLQELVDFPSLRVSLIKQIRDAYRKQTDKSAPSERSVGAAVGGAQMSHPERLVNLLGKGSVSTDPSLRSSLAAPFAPSSFGSPWQVWLNSDYSGRTFYVTVPVDRPSDQRFRIRLRLVRWDWKLLALELPESTKAHIIEEFARMMDDRPSSPAR
jgi:Protein of unknown function (DUF2939)